MSVSAVSASVCPRDGKVNLPATLTGYVIHGLSPHSSDQGLIGSETCPWFFIAKSGQRLQLKIIVLSDEDTKPTSHEDAILCSSIFVVIDVITGITELAVCSGRARERHLYTSSGSQITLHMSRDQMSDRGLVDHGMEFPRFLISYEGEIM